MHTDWTPLLCFVIAVAIGLAYVLPDKHVPLMAELLAGSYVVIASCGFVLGIKRGGRSTWRLVGALLCALSLLLALAMMLLAVSVFRELN